MNTLRTLLEDYLAMRRALGFKLRSEGTGLTTFVSYAEAAGIDHITNAVALSWARLPESVQSAQRAKRNTVQINRHESQSAHHDFDTRTRWRERARHCQRRSTSHI